MPTLGSRLPELPIIVGRWTTRGESDAAADKLGAALPELARLGGSHAQREVFEDTYIAACLRAGRHDKAAERLTARLARRPSARDRDWLAAMPTG